MMIPKGLGGVVLFARARRIVAPLWSRLANAWRKLWQWVFPPVPKELRRALWWGPRLIRFMMVVFLLSVLQLALWNVLGLLLPNPPADSLLAKLREGFLIASNWLLIAVLVGYGVRTYLDYRRLARWRKVEVRGHRYQVPQALALRSAFLVPAILDYLHEHFNSKTVRAYLQERPHLLSGGRYPWQETLVSPISGKIYVLPRSRWQRFVDKIWNLFLWNFSYHVCRFVHEVCKCFPTAKKAKISLKKTLRQLSQINLNKISLKKMLRQLSQINLKKLLPKLLFWMGVGAISLILGFVIGMVATLPLWIYPYLGIGEDWVILISAIWMILMMEVFYLLIRRGKRPKYKNKSHRKARNGMSLKNLFSFWKSKENGVQDKEKGKAENTIQEEGSKAASEALAESEAKLVKITEDSPKKPEKRLQGAKPQEQEKVTMWESEETTADEVERLLAPVLLSSLGSLWGRKEEPLWMHSLGMGFLWDFPTDGELLRRYEALPPEAKGMLHAIMMEVMDQFNNPEGRYTSLAYPEHEEKRIYLTLPGTKDVFEARYPDPESAKMVEDDLLPSFFDYYRLSAMEALKSGKSPAPEEEEKAKLVLAGYEGGYRLSDYAQLFGSIVEMKASFWAAYQVAWRIMRMVSEELNDYAYFGEPLTLPVLRGESYVELKGMEFFELEKISWE